VAAADLHQISLLELDSQRLGLVVVYPSASVKCLLAAFIVFASAAFGQTATVTDVTPEWSIRYRR